MILEKIHEKLQIIKNFSIAIDFYFKIFYNIFMKKIFNIVLSLATIALFIFYIYTKITNPITFTNFEQFILDYGSLILLGLFTFNNLLAKVVGVFFFIFVLVVIVFVILILNPTLITNLFFVAI